MIDLKWYTLPLLLLLHFVEVLTLLQTLSDIVSVSVVVISISPSVSISFDIIGQFSHCS